MVGILLPPSVPGALVNYAAALAGKVPVNLNYTSSDESLASCAAQCKLETVITTKQLLDRIPLKVPGKTILLEEIAVRPRLRRAARGAVPVVLSRGERSNGSSAAERTRRSTISPPSFFPAAARASPRA